MASSNQYEHKMEQAVTTTVQALNDSAQRSAVDLDCIKQLVDVSEIHNDPKEQQDSTGVLNTCGSNNEARAVQGTGASENHNLVRKKKNLAIQAKTRVIPSHRLPSFGHYCVANGSIFMDRRAADFLDIDPSLCGHYVSARKVLRTLGFEISHQILTHFRFLSDPKPCFARNICSGTHCPDCFTYEQRVAVKCPLLTTTMYLQQATHVFGDIYCFYFERGNHNAHKSLRNLKLSTKKQQQGKVSFFELSSPTLPVNAVVDPANQVFYQKTVVNLDCFNPFTGEAEYKPSDIIRANSPSELAIKCRWDLRLESLNYAPYELKAYPKLQATVDYYEDYAGHIAATFYLANYRNLIAHDPDATYSYRLSNSVMERMHRLEIVNSSLQDRYSHLALSTKLFSYKNDALRNLVSFNNETNHKFSKSMGDLNRLNGSDQYRRAFNDHEITLDPNLENSQAAHAALERKIIAYSNKIQSQVFNEQKVEISEQERDQLFAMVQTREEQDNGSYFYELQQPDNTDVELSHTSDLINDKKKFSPRSGYIYINANGDCDRIGFAILFNKGKHAGFKAYIKLNAFFDHNHKINYLNFTISKVASSIFELAPHLVTDSASFDYSLHGEMNFGRNYYNILGYSNNDPQVPTSRKGWVETIVHPEDRSTLTTDREILYKVNNANSIETLYRSQCKDGSYIWTKSISQIVSRDSYGIPARIIGINIEINRVLEGYENLQNRVMTDILTGIKNRTYLTTNLHRIIAESGTRLSVIFADVTALKVYNDYLGHSIGDKLLCSATLILQEAIHRPNELIRMSGDEVICLLPHCDKKEATRLEVQLNIAVAQYNVDAPVRMPVFFSVGSATIDLSDFAGRNDLSDEDKSFVHDLFYQAVQVADHRMQEHKRANRDAHYSLVKAYIEKALNTTISLYDSRTDSEDGAELDEMLS